MTVANEGGKWKRGIGRFLPNITLPEPPLQAEEQLQLIVKLNVVIALLDLIGMGGSREGGTKDSARHQL